MRTKTTTELIFFPLIIAHIIFGCALLFTDFYSNFTIIP